MKIAVVIPTYKAKNSILKVIKQIGSEVNLIMVVDDCCPQASGAFVLQHCQDVRVHVLFHKENQGVGGAMQTGFRYALEKDIDIVVKIDSDGQMDPQLIPEFVEPILNGEADFCKGNRFYSIENLHQMPYIRLLGNSCLSFISKLSSGYWNLMDPTNGYLAISKEALKRVSIDKLSKRYFFESDLLFRLGLARAVVQDIPMQACYGDEESHLKIQKVIFEFSYLHLNRLCKRIFYQYFMRDFNFGSVSLLVGSLMFSWGLLFLLYQRHVHSSLNQLTPTGTIILGTLLVIMGFQLILNFIQFDIGNLPQKCLTKRKANLLNGKTSDVQDRSISY